jgi:excisionase family DNA binding protein
VAPSRNRAPLRRPGRGAMSESALWTTREVAEYLNVSPETVLRWHRSGKLPGGRRLSSNLLRFAQAEVEAWLDGLSPPPLDRGGRSGILSRHTNREGGNDE